MKHKVLLVLLLGIIISVSASAQKVTMNLKAVIYDSTLALSL